MKPTADKTEVDHYEYNVDNSDPIHYQPEEISHIKTFNPLDDWRGLAPVSVARAIIETLNAAKTWNKSMLENLARPSGVLFSPGSPQSVQSTDSSTNSGSDMLGLRTRIIQVLEGGAEWENQQMNAHDLDFVEGQKMNAREISIILQVPSELLNDVTNKTYNNQKEAISIFYHDCILPFLTRSLKSSMSLWFILMIRRWNSNTT